MNNADIRHCPGCMQELPSPGICPRCGFDAAKYEPPLHQLKPGSILNGKYLVGRALGEGGFGITYIGLDLNLEIRVAIKEYYPNGFVSRHASISLSVTPLTGTQGEQYGKGLERFVQEARSLAKFHDLSGIVSVKDFFKENGTAYIVMEYIEGETLKQYLAKKGGRLPVEEALSILRPVMESLAFIHSAGIIHRDISPDNIMLTRRGAKLIDFGAARTYVDEENRSRTVTLKSGYAPYEQYQTRGEQGPWTDVYALCATLYRCVTGSTPPESIERLDEDTLVAPSLLHTTLTPLQEAMLLKGLSVRARDRYQDIPQLLHALQGGDSAKPAPKSIPFNESIPEPVIKPRKVSPKALFIGGGILALLVALIIIPSIPAEGPVFTPPPAGKAAVSTFSPDAPVVTPDAPAVIPVVTNTLEPEESAAPALQEMPAKNAAQLAQDNRFTVAAGNRHVIFLKSGSSLGSVGSDLYGQRSLEAWGATALAAGYAHTIALLADGSAMGNPVLSPAGEEPYDYGQCDVSDWMNLVQIEAGWVHSVGLVSGGTVVAVGDNAHGQCNVESWNDVVEIAAGGWNTAALTADGRVLVAGDNEYGQCDISWKNEGIVHIAVGRQFVAGLRQDGTVVAAGRNLQNQCEVSSWSDIVAIAVGDYHTIGLKADGTVVTTSFTGTNAYGQDETGGWRDIVAVYGGARTTVGMQSDGTLLIAGLVDKDSYTQTGALQEKVWVNE